MPIFLIETDNSWIPLDPFGGYFGPIVLEIPAQWIGQEPDCDNVLSVVPEIEFPTVRHYRRTDWLCFCARPSRAFPRGMRTRLVPGAGTVGTEPPGLINNWLRCWSPNPADASRERATYDDGDGELPAVWMEFATNATGHSTLADPLSYTDADFVCSLVARYRSSDGGFWILGAAPPGYAFVDALSQPPLPALAIARPNLPPPVNKNRSVVVLDPYQQRCPDPWSIWPSEYSPVGNSVLNIQMPPNNGELEVRCRLQGTNHGTGGVVSLGIQTGPNFIIARGTSFGALPEQQSWTLEAANGRIAASSTPIQSGTECQVKWFMNSDGSATGQFWYAGALDMELTGITDWDRCGGDLIALSSFPGVPFPIEWGPVERYWRLGNHSVNSGPIPVPA